MEILKDYRKKIDDLDVKIIDLLAERFSTIREVADIKEKNNIPAVLQDRVDEVRENAKRYGKTKGLDESFVHALYELLIRESCELEDRIMNTNRNQKTG